MTLKSSRLKENSFAVLEITTRDDRHRIVERAEEKSLELDQDTCHRARAELTSPKVRLKAEMSWLPGLSPTKVWQVMSLLHSNPGSLREESGLPTLAHLNLLAAFIEIADDEITPDDMVGLIQQMASLADDLAPEQVLRDINEDRAVSRFPEVGRVELVDDELSEQKRYYRETLIEGLDRFTSPSLVDVMSEAVDQATCGGEEHAPELIDDLVDNYAVRTQGFLQKEAVAVEKLIQVARDSAQNGEDAVKPTVEKLLAVARNWDKVAQPIQLSFQGRGIDHDPSRELAYSIRSLAIHLFNNYDMLSLSQKLTELIQELFAELPEIVERVDEDAEALEDISLDREQNETQKREWERNITYRAEVGAILKDVLSISPDGISWKNQNFPLNEITRLRWGGVRHSVNGIPTGTNYTVAFGDDRAEAVVHLKKESIYSGFLERLWRAVGARLLTELLDTLETGSEIRFGKATLRDDGVTLIKHKFLGANEMVRCTWGQVSVWSAEGKFWIGAKDDEKTYVDLSYIDYANTHILEQAIRMAFKKSGMVRLSDIL
jgi:hypothetical protein